MIYTVTKMFSFNLNDKDDMELYNSVVVENKDAIKKAGWIFKENGSSVMLLSTAFSTVDPKSLLKSESKKDIFYSVEDEEND